jgi:uncharacterized protein (TIGR01777 family)
LHAAREALYGALFFGLAWRAWHGAWAWVVVGILVAEIVVTIVDFVIEDSTRRLPRTERVLHTVLAINFGVVLACFAPVLRQWQAAPTALVAADYGWISLLFTVASVVVLLWGLRDALAMAHWFRRPQWQCSELAPKSSSSGRSVLVTGATGFIGRHLVRRLIARGDDVIVLTRVRDKAVDAFGPYADVYTDLAHIDAQRRIDAVVNLAGAPIAALPWSKRRRRVLLESRLGVTRALLTLVARLERKPRTWINASAIGFYGARRDDLRLHEKSPAGRGFQSRLCVEWESLAASAAEHGVKVTMLRIGLVLGTGGGPLPALARPVRFGLGTLFGDGTQWVSWIHIDDLVALILFVLTEATHAGPCNATAPEPVTHARFMRAIAQRLGRRPIPLRIPAAGLRALAGDLAELFVEGQRVLPERAIALGFEFTHRRIDTALAAIEIAPVQPSLAATSSPSSPGTATR